MDPASIGTKCSPLNYHCMPQIDMPGPPTFGDTNFAGRTAQHSRNKTILDGMLHASKTQITYSPLSQDLYETSANHRVTSFEA